MRLEVCCTPGQDFFTKLVEICACGQFKFVATFAAANHISKKVHKVSNEKANRVAMRRLVRVFNDESNNYFDQCADAKQPRQGVLFTCRQLEVQFQRVQCVDDFSRCRCTKMMHHI